MADKGYTIGPPVMRSTLPICPWYKEKLSTKYLSDTRKRHLSVALDGRSSRFQNARCDDFRDVHPTPSYTSIFPRAGSDTFPPIFAMPNTTCLSDKKQKKRVSKEQACFSKENPRQQSRRKHMEAVELKLKQHPLVMYPHYKHNMPPELFDQVLSVLEPDTCVNRACVVTSAEKEEHSGDCTEACKTNEQESGSEEDAMQVDFQEEILYYRNEKSLDWDSRLQPSCKNPYKRLRTKPSRDKTDQAVNTERLYSPSQDKDLKKVTTLFCNWDASLGGENNLTESTLLDMFVSEKTSSLTFPTQEVKAKNMPENLQKSLEDLSQASACEARLNDSEQYKNKSGTTRPKYGAWYLDSKTRNKIYADEQLPNINFNSEDSEFLGQSSEKDEEFKQMYGAQSFKQYIIHKGLRVPGFMSSLFAEEQDSQYRPDTARSAPSRKDKRVL